jgi:hypothetical protein
VRIKAIPILPGTEGDREVAAAKRLTEGLLHPDGFAAAVPLLMALRATGRIN